VLDTLHLHDKQRLDSRKANGLDSMEALILKPDTPKRRMPLWLRHKIQTLLRKARPAGPEHPGLKPVSR
jgi:hypothetical protein